MNAVYLLDTCVLIDYERGVQSTIDFVKNNRCAVSTIAIMEFDQGYKKPFKTVFAGIETIDLTTEIASISAKKLTTLRAIKTKKGKNLYSKEEILRISFDSIVAATAKAHKLTVVTGNQKDFSLFNQIEFIQV